MVNTAVVILQKEKDAAKRDANPVKFVRVKKAIDTKELVDAIKDAIKTKDDRTLRISIISQAELHKMTKWSIHIRAPPVYHKIISSPKMTKMKTVADIRRGITSGAKEFFYLNHETIKAWGIEKQYISPVLISPRDTKGIIIENSKHFVLDVHKSKSNLHGTGVLKYIEYGEQQKYNIRPTTRNRQYWYDIGERSPALILCARLIWTKLFFIWNKANALANDIFYEIRPHNEKDTLVLLGFLNSSITNLLFESIGRSYGGGVLELKVYEAKEFPVINPDLLSTQDKNRLEKAFLKLANEQTQSNQRELDNVMFDILQFDNNEQMLVYNALKDAQSIRDNRRDKEVLVEGD